MSLDCCREFDLSSGGLCSEVLQYIHQDIIKTKDLQEHFFPNFLPSFIWGSFVILKCPDCGISGI